MSLAPPITERSRRVHGAFPLEEAVAHDGAVVVRGPRLTFTTPAATWSSAVTLPARWPTGAGWIDTRDGVVRVRLSDIHGVVSVLALDDAAMVIDEVRVSDDDGPVDV